MTNQELRKLYEDILRTRERIKEERRVHRAAGTETPVDPSLSPEPRTAIV